MKFAVTCVLLLAISEPLLTNAKRVVVVVPRQIRRSPLTPRRPNVGGQSSRSYGSESDYHQSSRPTIYRARKPPAFGKGPPFPHGGDDFDQGHETVNHVSIPYGKGVSHGVSFGRGYIPYDNVKHGFTQERYLSFMGRKPQEPDFSPSNFQPSSSGYVGLPSSSYQPRIPDGYVETEPSDYDGLTETGRFYSQRSIGDSAIVADNYDPVATTTEAEVEERPASSTNLLANVDGSGQRMEGAVLLPAGIPPTTIAGSRQGVVIRDTVSLDEYKRTVNEFTKSWPNVFVSQLDAASQSARQSPVYSQSSYDQAALRPAWPIDFAQPKRGYDVKEDLVEPPRDFRTMPVHAATFNGVASNFPVAGQVMGQFMHG